jgi:hypothetical protein
MPVAEKALRTIPGSRATSGRFSCAYRRRGRTHRLQLSGYLTPKVWEALRKEYVVKFEDDDSVDVTGTDWYKESERRLHRGGLIGILRGHRDLSQGDLGKILNVTGKYVSDMEHGRRAVSVKMAKKLSVVFGRRPERFLPLDE